MSIAHSIYFLSLYSLSPDVVMAMMMIMTMMMMLRMAAVFPGLSILNFMSQTPRLQWFPVATMRFWYVGNTLRKFLLMQMLDDLRTFQAKCWVIASIFVSYNALALGLLASDRGLSEESEL